MRGVGSVAFTVKRKGENVLKGKGIGANFYVIAVVAEAFAFERLIVNLAKKQQKKKHSTVNSNSSPPKPLKKPQSTAYSCTH